MKKYLSAIIMLAVLCGLAVTGRAKIMDKPDMPGVAAVGPTEFQAIRASVVNSALTNYTLDTRKFANIGVNEKAPVFAVYTASTLPSKCGDFRQDQISEWKVSKYRRAYNFETHPEILQALKHYGCVVLNNPDGASSVAEAPSP